MPVSAPFIDEVFLSVNDNNISFTFSALNYAVENTDLYEYCLEEYDKEWKTLMKGNQVSYTELPVGDYMFRVRAASNPAAIKAVRVVVAGNTPFIRWIVVLLEFLFRALADVLLVFPVRRDAVFRRLVHLPGADLHLKRNALRADDGRVERLVHVGLRSRDIVLEPAGNGVKEVVDVA